MPNNEEYEKEYELMNELKKQGIIPDDSPDKMSEEEKERKLRELRNSLFKAFRDSRGGRG